MQRELDKFFGPNAAASLPASGKLADWFVYRKQEPISLKEIAKATDYTYGYVRRKHSEYLRKSRKK
jgi:hypothetical protein